MYWLLPKRDPGTFLDLPFAHQWSSRVEIQQLLLFWRLVRSSLPKTKDLRSNSQKYRPNDEKMRFTLGKIWAGFWSILGIFKKCS